MTSPMPIYAAFILALAGCKAEPGAEAPAGETSEGGSPAAVQPLDADDQDGTAFDGIKPDETVRITGNEPFWGGEVVGAVLAYSTPEVPDGTVIAVTRFAGRGGVSWSGTYSGARFTLAVTPGRCSDGMSERTYPFVATLKIAGEQRDGCAWTKRNPFSGPANP